MSMDRTHTRDTMSPTRDTLSPPPTNRDTLSPTPSRPRPHSRLSFGSHRSGNSEGRLSRSESRPKYTESPADKARRDSFWKGGSKSNPNSAMQEEQPGEANLHELSTLQHLRDYQHLDAFGNPITDPDLANPTRPRLERPLDTIKSFEKAIDDGYKRRSTYVKQDSETWDQSNQFASRRNSQFSMLGSEGPAPSRLSQQQQPGGYYGGQNGHGPRARYSNNRMQSDPSFYGQARYPNHSYHQSHDTVNTHGSDSTGPWANSTDPSSENSSLDRVNASKPGDPYGSYGHNGYNGAIMEEGGQYDEYNGYGQQGGYGQPPAGYPPQQQQQNGGYGRPPPPPQESGPRRPIPLTSGPPPPSNGLPSNGPTTTGKDEKRKSWFSRRFNKKD